MLESLSPYQLLKASRPKSPTYIDTAPQKTDHAVVPAYEPPPSIPDAPANAAPSTQQSIRKQNQRTHYISDIHSRHAAAQRYLPT